jgi:hypothetical protein
MTLGERYRQDWPEISRPYPWERKMTICIAAICNEFRGDCKILLCHDWQISSELGSAEVRNKATHLGKGVYCLSSGTDGEVTAALIHLKHKFDSEKDPIDERNFTKLVRNALLERKAEKCDEFIRGRFAISYDDFLRNGKAWLPSDLFNVAQSDVVSMSIKANFVVAAFSTSGYPMICETDDFAKVTPKDDYALAGIGRFLAQTALLQRHFMTVNDLPEATYKVFEAKKYAENVPGVGDITSLAVLTKNNPPISMKTEGIEYLKMQFFQYGPQFLGINAIKLTKEHWWGEP